MRTAIRTDLWTDRHHEEYKDWIYGRLYGQTNERAGGGEGVTETAASLIKNKDRVIDMLVD